MKPLFTKEEFDMAKSSDELMCECYICQSPFTQLKKHIKSKYNKNMFCSKECLSKHQSRKVTVNCTNCKLPIEKTPSEINKSKSGNHFCSKSCSVTFNNKNKKHGTRRSKLEAWLESELNTIYPNITIHFNRKDTIGSELDIYIPSLKLAFELNGIFHYEPIYGINKLKNIQENDKSKTKACHDFKIDLCIINTSTQKYFKISTSQKYLDIITNIINERLK